MTDNSEFYSASFYAGQSDNSHTAALALLPTVFDLVKPTSVIVIGCGMGTWLAVARSLGAIRIVGLEGPWVRAKDLRDPAITLVTTDLEQPIPVHETFDLAMSLEVAEHLSEQRAATLVEEIARLAPVVLFETAIPAQGGGFNHINEQWKSYWVTNIARRGYHAIDILRPKFWTVRAIPSHYRQNPLLYIHESVADRYRAAALAATTRFPPDMVHPDVHLSMLASIHALPTLGQAVRAAAGLPAARRSATVRLGLRPRLNQDVQ